MEAPLTILYTQHIRGNLNLLPHLYTFVKGLRAEYGGRVLLLDAGDSCTPQEWHCDATGGRSTLIVLDAMGYHAANVDGFLSDDARAKLGEQVKVALVDSVHAWRDHDIIIAAGNPVDETAVAALSNSWHSEELALQIVVSADGETQLERGVLYLSAVDTAQVGVVRLHVVADDNGGHYTALAAGEVLDLPPGTPPDATISGTVDFVLSEAQYYTRKHGST